MISFLCPNRSYGYGYIHFSVPGVAGYLLPQITPASIDFPREYWVTPQKGGFEFRWRQPDIGDAVSCQFIYTLTQNRDFNPKEEIKAQSGSHTKGANPDLLK